MDFEWQRGGSSTIYLESQLKRRRRRIVDKSIIAATAYLLIHIFKDYWEYFRGVLKE